MATYKKTAKEKGQLLYEEAMKSGRVLNQGVNPLTGKKGTGQAIATPTGLQKITKTNAQGLPVGGTRSAPGAITSDQMTPTSYEDIGKIQQENDYQATLDAAQELGLGEDAPTKMDEYIKMKVEAKKRQDASQNLALEGQRMDLRSQGQSIRSQSDYGQAMAASGLNGPQTNTALAGGYQEAAQAQLARLKIDDQRLAMYAEDLKDAQASGDLELAQSIQAERDAYTNQAMANEAAYVSALGDYEKTKAAVTQSNLSSFQALVDEGQELSVEAISGFAGQLGIPFEDAYGYYAGVQSIRDDKTLSLEEKELAIADAKYGLDQKMKGLSTKEAQAVNDYITLVQSGIYTPEQLKAFAISMNIPDENNPVYQADLAVKQAEAKIKTAEANGEILSPQDKLDYYNAISERNAYYGIEGQAYVPTESLEGLNATFDGQKMLITGGQKKDYQCAEFVNRVWGLSSGGSGGFGSSYNEKLGKISVSSSEITDENFSQIVKPGMAFIMGASGNASQYGHVGIVTQVFPDGSFFTAETNIAGDVINSSPAVEKLRNYKDVDGFAVPPSYNVEGSGEAGLADSFSTAVSSIGFATVAQSEVATAQIDKLVSSGQYEKAKDYLLTQVKNNSSATERGVLDGKENTIVALDTLNQKLAEFVEKGGDTGIFTGLKEKALQKGGFTSDPELAEIANSIGLAIVDYRRAISGAAFTESEGKAYDEIFPSVGKTSELNQAKINSIQEKLKTDLANYYRSRLGGSTYDEIFSPTSSKKTEEGVLDGGYTSEWQVFTPVEEELDGIQ